MDVATLYRHRFPPAHIKKMDRIWAVLCRDFFQRYIPDDACVLDLACGYGWFINNIVAGKKYATDINPDSAKHLNDDISFVQSEATSIQDLKDCRFDVVFTSNFLEHLPDKPALSQVFREMHRLLSPGGRFIILGPNIRYVGGAYWDFFDHHLPLTHLSLIEGLGLHGFAVETVFDRFLPYTSQSALPKHPLLVQLYLKVPLAWRVLGQQFLVVARKEGWTEVP